MGMYIWNCLDRANARMYSITYKQYYTEGMILQNLLTALYLETLARNIVPWSTINFDPFN